MKFLFLFCTVLFFIILLALYLNITDLRHINVKQLQFSDSIGKTNSDKSDDNMKYILLWPSQSKVNVPFVYLDEGQKCFLDRNCMYVNCFVTTDESLLGSHSKFDVILFSGPEVQEMIANGNSFPSVRSPHQKYVFASIEAANTYTINSNFFDKYFNWTWTYKLDSDLRWGYIVIRDLKNNIIGPQKDMNWLKLEEMDPVTDDFKNKLRTKKRAAAWFASNCYSESGRESFVKELREELWKYRHFLDVYGECGLHVCSRNKEKVCDEKIAEYYYFYMAFENAFSDDYVTEKLVRALKYDAVPVVFGGANYTRFMPDGIYLNALDLGVKKLAAKMNELISKPDEYANYFRWKHHYKYERTTENVDTNEYCRMCELLNDDDAVTRTTIYEDFRQWWNPKNSDADFYAKKLYLALNG